MSVVDSEYHLISQTPGTFDVIIIPASVISMEPQKNGKKLEYDVEPQGILVIG